MSEKDHLMSEDVKKVLEKIGFKVVKEAEWRKKSEERLKEFLKSMSRSLDILITPFALIIYKAKMEGMIREEKRKMRLWLIWANIMAIITGLGIPLILSEFNMMILMIVIISACTVIIAIQRAYKHLKKMEKLIKKMQEEVQKIKEKA